MIVWTGSAGCALLGDPRGCDFTRRLSQHVAANQTVDNPKVYTLGFVHWVLRVEDFRP